MSERVLHRSDQDSELAVSGGDTVEVELPETASTGFQWAVTASPDGVELLDDEPRMPAGALPGAEGSHRFRFRIGSRPSGQLALELRRSWEHAQRPADRFAVRLSGSERDEEVDGI